MEAQIRKYRHDWSPRATPRALSIVDRDRVKGRHPASGDSDLPFGSRHGVSLCVRATA
jgi:hypothetical protein